MSSDRAAAARSTVMHVRCPDRLPDETYRQVLEQLAGLSPVVQALPPSAALVELKGALRYHNADARHLGEILRVRTISRLGVDVRIGIGPSITVAATASAQVEAPGGVLAIDPDHAAAWLATLLVDPLRGVRHSGHDAHLAQLPAGTLLDLVRDPGNQVDPNAIHVQHQGVFLGWIAREIARPLALALDEEPAPRIYVQLTTDARSIAQQNGADQLHGRDAITLTVMIAPQ
ncbi:hypothetical protein [Streptomyces sp. NPDC046832]|uniref:hypothetical protein n=1 Tax=Streptomyces sp. NPDC046832 TaxID=3155020 RepID=UPI0033D76591